MDRVTPQLMSFEEFLEWHPNDGSIFELINGVPIDRLPVDSVTSPSTFTSSL
jgi:hypothetical protein